MACFIVYLICFRTYKNYQLPVNNYLNAVCDSYLLPDHCLLFTDHCLVEAESCWLVSSNGFDVIGAVGAGINGAWVRRSADALFDLRGKSWAGGSKLRVAGISRSTFVTVPPGVSRLGPGRERWGNPG